MGLLLLTVCKEYLLYYLNQLGNINMGIRTPITLNKRKVEGNAKRARKAASKKFADLKDIVIGHYMRVTPETFDKMKYF